MNPSSPGQERRTEWFVFGCFIVAAAGAIALAVVYAYGGRPTAEGSLLGLSFAALSAGLVTWAHRLLANRQYAEDRPLLRSSEAQRQALVGDIEREGLLSRRKLLLTGLGTAVGAMAVAAVFPIRSLGPSPGNSLSTTPWRKGLRLVTENGAPVHAAAVPEGGLVTVFPDGFPGSADGQAVLVRVQPERLSRARRAGAPNGLIVFSKVCTHAGCPVGLYQAQIHQLLCPCHQSAFDVLRGAVPVFGPAARALPQLPIEIDSDGVLRATGDFPEPIGPAYWNRR
ncbi:MAG: Rieske (2Fe-2S) domain protein [Actinomycetia bacterium]|nr:Rieske (2Fe-2S) domain protein [Actinomycetes bacterium]